MIARSALSAALGLAALVGTVLALAAPAQGHVRATTVYADASAQGREVAVSLSLEYDLLTTATGLGEDAVSAEASLEQARHLENGTAAVTAYAVERFTVSQGGVACPGKAAGAPGVEDRLGTAYAALSLVYHCPVEGTVRMTSEVFSAEDAVVDDQTTVLRYDLDGHTGTEVLDVSRPTFTAGEQSFLRVVPDFLAMGVEHLVLGLDHILFVLALLFGARGWREVLAVASVFTVAHSVTLLLGALGLVGVPAWLVEPLIALSIVFVALDNLLGARLGHRLPIVFGFGLLHGLGFAGTLSLDAGLSWSLLASLVAFNLGIELGQLLVVALVFPLVLLLRRTPRPTLLLAGATGAVAVVGLFWFVQRVPLISPLLPSVLA